MAKMDAHRSLLEALGERGLLEYGAEIMREEVHEILGLEMPEVGTKAEFDSIALQELSAVDYVRNVMLGHGKYLAGTRAGYRILLPSENASQIEQYIGSADKKLSRALKLSRNTPGTAASVGQDQTEARIAMKRHGMSSRRVLGGGKNT